MGYIYLRTDEYLVYIIYGIYLSLNKYITLNVSNSEKEEPIITELNIKIKNMHKEGGKNIYITCNI